MDLKEFLSEIEKSEDPDCERFVQLISMHVKTGTVERYSSRVVMIFTPSERKYKVKIAGEVYNKLIIYEEESGTVISYIGNWLELNNQINKILS